MKFQNLIVSLIQKKEFCGFYRNKTKIGVVCCNIDEILFIFWILSCLLFGLLLYRRIRIYGAGITFDRSDDIYAKCIFISFKYFKRTASIYTL